MLLVVGMGLTGMLATPGRLLSAPPVPGSGDRDANVKIPMGETSPVYDDKGNLIGTSTTTTRPSGTTVTETVTAGRDAGQTATINKGPDGMISSFTVKEPDGTTTTWKRDADGGATSTRTENGLVVTTKSDAAVMP